MAPALGSGLKTTGHVTATGTLGMWTRENPTEAAKDAKGSWWSKQLWMIPRTTNTRWTN